MLRKDIQKFEDYNRPRVTRDRAALEAVTLVEELLDVMPSLDITERDYQQLVNCYARRLRTRASELENQLVRDWGQR